MRIQAKQLDPYLKRSLAPFYLVFGEEPLQRMEVLDKIRSEAKKQGYIERVVLDFSHQADWETLLLQDHSLSLFSDKRLFECRLNEGKIGKKGADTLMQLTRTHHDHHLFLFIFSDKLEKNVMESTWFKTIENAGLGIVANLPKGPEFSVWVKARLLSEGFTFQDDIVDTLAEKTEGNLLAAAQAIERLKLTHVEVEKKLLSLEELNHSIEADTRFSLFDLVDSIINGAIGRTSAILTSLRNEGTELILILWVLTREVRNIIPLARLLKEGSLKREHFKEHGVWQHRIGPVNVFLKRCPLESLHQTLIEAKNIDSLIKKSESEEAFQRIRSLSLSLAGVPDV